MNFLVSSHKRYKRNCFDVWHKNSLEIILSHHQTIVCVVLHTNMKKSSKKNPQSWATERKKIDDKTKRTKNCMHAAPKSIQKTSNCWLYRFHRIFFSIALPFIRSMHLLQWNGCVSVCMFVLTRYILLASK